MKLHLCLASSVLLIAAIALTACQPVAGVSLADDSAKKGESTADQSASNSNGSASASNPTLPPGIVKNKPASGRFVKTELGYMVPYTAKIPGTNIEYEMVPVPGGTFKLGSPDSEEDRNDDEGPQITVEVEPFWMGKYEVTWSEYMQYMDMYRIFKSLAGVATSMTPWPDIDLTGKTPEQIAAIEKQKKRHERHRAAVTKSIPQYKRLQVWVESKKKAAGKTNTVDGVTSPTPLYDPSFTYEYGDDPRQPAVTMTPYAAKQYTKWLSKLTGRFYRLPSESEWEYACRAGTTTAYHFGDDPEQIGDYAWYYDNADEDADDVTSHRVGLKKPNPWGLYDMHGNVAELVLDEHIADQYEKHKGKTVKASDLIAWPKKPFPRVYRGGSWEDDPEQLRSAARAGTHDVDWKGADPNNPLSPWWYTSDPSRGVGMRIIRPLRAPAKDQQQKFWQPSDKQTIFEVADRLKEGRGALEAVNQEIPTTIAELNKLLEAEKLDFVEKEKDEEE